MAFLSHVVSAHESALKSSKARCNWYARFVLALMLSRQRQADREIARYIALNGGKLTDATERVIEQRFLARPRGF